MKQQEYIELLEKYLEEQYGSHIDDQMSEEDYESDPYYHIKITTSMQEHIDLSSADKDKIYDSIGKYKNITIDNFRVVINGYRGFKVNSVTQMNLDISIYEIKNKFLNKIDIFKDKRFNKYKSMSKSANVPILKDISMDDVVSLIQWCQKLKRLITFI